MREPFSAQAALFIIAAQGTALAVQTVIFYGAIGGQACQRTRLHVCCVCSAVRDRGRVSGLPESRSLDAFPGAMLCRVGGRQDGTVRGGLCATRVAAGDDLWLSWPAQLVMQALTHVHVPSRESFCLRALHSPRQSDR